MKIDHKIDVLMIVDLSILHFSETKTNHIYSVFEAAGFTDDVIEKNDLDRKMNEAILALESLEYISNINEDKYRLTELGKQVKSIGGHFAYLKSLEETSKAEARRQELNDQKLEAELDIVKFQRGLGKKLTIWGVAISVIAIITSVLTTVATNNKEAQPSRIDTVSLKQQLHMLDLRIQKLEQQKLKDTIPKE